MKIRNLCLVLLMVFAIAAPFAARCEGAYNDADMTPTNRVEWWWKFVHEIHPQWEDQVSIVNVTIGQDVIDLRTQDATTAVMFTFQNTSAQVAKCDGSVALWHTVVGRDGSVLYREAMTRVALPTYLKPGEKFMVTGRAFTSAKLRGNKQVAEVETF